MLSPEACVSYSHEEVIAKAIQLISIAPTIASAHRALGERPELESDEIKSALKLLKLYDAAASNATRLLDDEVLRGARQAGRRIDTQFCTTLLAGDKNKENKDVEKACSGATVGEAGGKGHSFAFAVTPTDEAQRISTLQRAARAMQLSLGLAATVPQSGLNLTGSVNYLKAASGSIDALERVPRVIGFAGRDPAVTNGVEGAAFGWLFGPEVSVDSKAKQLALRQTAMDRIVTTDLSVPAWWPRMRLAVETTWAGKLAHLKFADGASLNRKEGSGEDGGIGKSTDIVVNLPRNMADLDGFTSLLFDRLGYGQQVQTRIDHVEPSTIRNCGDNVPLLIQGSELWREPRVFLAGIAAKDGEYNVLPDMGGVVAQFDLRTLAGQISGGNETRTLTVWTRIGEARKQVRIVCPKPASKKEVKTSYKGQVSQLKGQVESANGEAGRTVADLEKRLAKLDTSKDPAKTLASELAAIKAKIAGLFDRAVKGSDGKGGLKALGPLASTIDTSINDFDAEIERLKALGQPTDVLQLRRDGKAKEGGAAVLEGKRFKAAFDAGLQKQNEALIALEGRISVLEPKS